MDTRRRVRPAKRADIAGIVALLRLRDPVAASRAELMVTRILSEPHLALVVDDPLLEGLTAALLARPGAESSDPWIVDALEVRQERDANPLIGALLSIAADRLVRSGVDALIVAVDPKRTRRQASLARAGLTMVSWTMWRAAVGTAQRFLDDYEPGLPLPHRNGHRNIGPITPVNATDGSALVSRTILPFGVPWALEAIDVLDPLVATTPQGLIDVLSATADPARLGPRDGIIGVALGDGEETLDVALRTLGFRRLVDWWSLELDRGPQASGTER